MLQYIDEMKDAIKSLNLDINDVIIVGSSSLTCLGVRKNNDIEFSVKKKAYSIIPIRYRLKLLFNDHIDISENVDLFRNRYLCIGITDKYLEEHGLYGKIDDFSIVKPEIEYLYKEKLKREKDLKDFKTINSNLDIYNAINWDYISAHHSKKLPLDALVKNKIRNIGNAVINIIWRIIH